MTITRQQLQTVVFGGTLPATLPLVNSGATSPLGGTADELVVTMAGGLTHKLYLHAPASPVGKLCIVHQGHNQTASGDGVGETVTQLLAAGVHVLFAAMPGFAPNTPTTGSTLHDDLALHDNFPSYLYPYFYPVCVGLNHALAVLSPSIVGMCGISGGGWTTLYYAALDDRIDRGVCFSGATRFDLRENPVGEHLEISEAEYWLPFCDAVLMACDAPSRVFVTVHNVADSCCFLDADGHRARFGTPLESLSGGRYQYGSINDAPNDHRISQQGRDNYLWPLMGLGDPPPPPLGEWIVDDGDAGFSQSGFLGISKPQAYGGDQYYQAAGSGAKYCQWDFGSKPAGTYRVEASWVRHPNRATNSPFSVYVDGVEVLFAPADQTGPNDDTLVWGVLGQFVTTGGVVTVKVTDAANGYVIADAVKLVQES